MGKKKKNRKHKKKKQAVQSNRPNKVVEKEEEEEFIEGSTLALGGGGQEKLLALGLGILLTFVSVVMGAVFSFIRFNNGEMEMFYGQFMWLLFTLIVGTWKIQDVNKNYSNNGKRPEEKIA